jgi:ubiquinone/menaquinone biosynthesis C-methylase UbiE
MPQSQPEEHAQNYIFRPEDGLETDIARLIEQYKFLFPIFNLFNDKYFTPTRGDETLLDVGCGPGSWALDVAFKYQDVSIIGLDIDEKAIAYATARAKVEHAENVSFEAHDATKGLPFKDESVDYININLANSFLLKSDWPRLFKECYRILRPGGWLRSIEWMTHQTSSPAIIRARQIFVEALLHEQRRFPEVAPFVRHLLQDAGLIPTPIEVHVLDFSEDSPAHKTSGDDLIIGFHLAAPYFIKMNVISQEECASLINEIQKDLMLPGFYAISLFCDISAQKRA